MYLRKIVFSLCVAIGALVPFYAPVANAQSEARESVVDLGIFEIGNVLVLPEADPRALAVNLINQVLSFLGILALIVFLWGGFLFLFSGGKQDKTDRAKAVIKNGIIGLIIIACSWTIVRFVLGALIEATSDPIAFRPSSFL